MGALYGALVVLHVLTAVVGFGAVVATGVAAGVVLRDTDVPAAARYFRPGWNWASLSLLLVPAFGAGLEAAHGWPDLHVAWPWIAFGLWSIAAVVAVMVHWPAERRIQRFVAAAAGVGAGGA